MVPRIPGLPRPPRAGPYRVLRAPEDDLAVEARRVGALVDAWLASQAGARPDATALGRAERRLHEAIKAGPLYGKILGFAGLNVWVDDRTPDGQVMSQECLNL